MESATTIDVAGDQLISIREACQLVPPPSPGTLHRWIHLGVLIGGDRVKLSTVRVGGKLFTTRQAYTEFIRRQNIEPKSDEPRARTADEKRRLAKAGLL